MDELYQAFTDTGLKPPDNLNHVPRTITDDPDPNAPVDRRHYYDQIGLVHRAAGGPPALSLGYKNSGMFDFTQDLVPADTEQELSFRMSDHFPLWVEFEV